MLELGGATLGELAATFAQRSGRRIEIADATLATVRIGGRFPTDDVDGFVRALAEIYDVESEQRPDGSIVLRRRR
jgi:transmembrane sensor